MTKIPFSEEELKVTGKDLKFYEPGAVPTFDIDRLNYPITPRENFLMALKGETPMWIPDYYDIDTCCPACYPDAIARGFVMGPEMFMPQYAIKDGDINVDSFGIKWQYVAVAGGSMEVPGEPHPIDDICDWKEGVKMPDVESWDWAGSKAAFDAREDNGKLRLFWIFTGYFERLISILGFEDAAMAMIDEDSEDDLREFFQACTDAYKKIAKHYREDFHADVLYLHDDWGSQRSPFMKKETIMEMIVPYLKQVVDYAHELGMLFEMHSCGKNDDLVECYAAAGVDFWEPQENINDFDKVIREADGRFMVGLWDNVSNHSESVEKMQEEAAAFVAKYAPDYKKHPVFTCNLWNVENEFKKAIYVQSRKAFLEQED